MRACTNCKHSHRGKDVEYTITPARSKDPNTDSPPGPLEMNSDLFWCDVPEQEGDSWTLLSSFKAFTMQPNWFEVIAENCSRYEEKEVKK